MVPMRGFVASLLAGVVAAAPWVGPAATPVAAPTNKDVETPQTTAAVAAQELFRRDSYPVSLCGWVGGDGGRPAWCSTHSSCVWNTDNHFVGCCPLGSDECGFYTSCVDINSDQPSANRNDVFTCRGTSLCYLNSYPKGFKQFGCGNSDDATTVLTSYSGFNTDLSLQIVLTGTGTSTKEVTIIATEVSTKTVTISTSTTSSGTSSATLTPTVETKSETTSSITGKATSSTPTPTPTPSAPPSTNTPTGAIAGGTVGGVVGLAALAGVMVFLLRRKNSDNKAEKYAQQGGAPGFYGPAELETPKQSPAPFQGVAAASSPHASELYSPPSTVSAKVPNGPVELP